MNGTSEPGVFNSFNSTLVQLKGARLEEAGYNPYSFNSTLVQLKALLVCKVKHRKLVSILP